MKSFFIVNPRAANGAAGRRWVELDARIERAVGPHGMAFTVGPQHAEQLTREALRDGYECVVAVGGDGTLNEVVNGFFDGEEQLNPDAKLGVIPFGTGGDFRRTFDWTRRLEHSLARLARGRTQSLDVGEATFEGHAGSRVRRYFVNVLSFGVSGEVVHQVNHTTKALGGRTSFYVGTVKAMMGYRDQPMKVRLDDGPEQEWTVTAVAVANGRYFGGGMCVAPNADPSDGLFDVTLWTGYRLFDFAVKGPALYSGRHLKLAGTQTFRCRTLEARSLDAPVRLDVDGEQPGHAPVSVRMRPGALTLIV